MISKLIYTKVPGSQATTNGATALISSALLKQLLTARATVRSQELTLKRLSVTIRASRKRYASLKDQLANSFASESSSLSAQPDVERLGTDEPFEDVESVSSD